MLTAEYKQLKQVTGKMALFLLPGCNPDNSSAESVTEKARGARAADQRWKLKVPLPSSCESSSRRSLPPLSTPEVWELPWLVIELQVFSLWCSALLEQLSSGPVSRGLVSASMPEVWELLWLVLE